MRRSEWVSAMLGWGVLCAAALVPGQIQARTQSVNLALSPADTQSNRLATTLTVDIAALNQRGSDSDTATLTGNILANLDLSVDPSTSAVSAVHSIEFTGGLIHMSNMSFHISFLFGSITLDVNTTGIAGIPSSPSGPGPVMGESFNTIDHPFVFNQGVITYSGLISGVLDLSASPIEASADTVGTISVSLEKIDGNQATYQVHLIVPVLFSELIISTGSTMTVAGSGRIAATGAFTLPICRLHSDLAGADCRVDLADLAAFSQQWLASSDQIPCPLSADLAGQDCLVGLDDLLVLAAEWLASEQP